ncbi:hypothetical protein ABL78_6661 [Leptomonas seymouri]|uniref:Uncharacterized protein n=1 Tax=Leptomonas seymouri TaxID=5684 RepID=A0A0N1HTH3_LEPSE|nr:hypothetical protein ABL78_6661 [Leptomonas seymouri]|eukprot:KPI84294.1 hypothetical protein ABL78_6661 [Leptomonas seymouri]
MSFGPSTRGETECTSASKTSAVGSSPGGVSTAATASSNTVTPGSVTRSCGSPIHPSCTTVQRVNGGSCPPSPLPRGCNASSGSVMAATTSAIETTLVAATPHRPDSPSTAAPLSLVPTPHRPNTNTIITTAATTAANGSQHNGIIRDGVGAPVAAAASSSGTLLPPLTRTNPSRHSLNDICAATAATAPSANTTPFSVVLPAIVTSHSTSGVVDSGENNRGNSKPEKKKGCTSSSASKAEPQPSLSTSHAVFPSAASSCAAAVARASPSSSVNSNSTEPDSTRCASQSAGEPYFRANNIPHLFNELSEALLEALPENPVAFITEWLRRRRDALE